MLRHWSTLLNTECQVVEISGRFLYPIFRNGSRSILAESEKILVNEQIAQCDHIDVLIRDTRDRFISGVNKFCQINDMKIEKVLGMISKDTLVDRHFSPQWIWLLHLSRYYEKDVTLRPFSAITEYCDTHINKSKKDQWQQVSVPDRYIKQDEVLLTQIDNTVNIQELVRKCKDGMS